MSSRAEVRRAKRDVGVVPPCNALAPQTRNVIYSERSVVHATGAGRLARPFNAMLYVH